MPSRAPPRGDSSRVPAGFGSSSPAAPGKCRSRLSRRSSGSALPSAGLAAARALPRGCEREPPPRVPFCPGGLLRGSAAPAAVPGQDLSSARGHVGNGDPLPPQTGPAPPASPRLQQLLLPPAPRCPWQGTRWKWSLSASASLGPPCPWGLSSSCRAGLGQSWAGTGLLVLLRGVTMSHGHPRGTGTVSLPSAPPS